MIVLGVDGGGTKTECVALAADGVVVGTGRGGPVNTNFVSAAVAARSLSDAMLGALGAGAGVRAEADVGAMVVGAPMRPALVRRVVASVLPGVRLELVSEGDLLLAAADWPEAGIALIAGTGSLAAGRRGRDGPLVVVGGWGNVMGDEGSAYDLARQALTAVARAADGRGPATMLTASVLKWANVAAPRDLPRAVYRRDSLARTRIAALSPLVSDAAQAGDPVAQTILAHAAGDLAELALTAARVLRFAPSNPITVSCGGGVLRQAPMLRSGIQDRLRTTLPGASLMVPAVSAAHAAATIALGCLAEGGG